MRVVITLTRYRVNHFAYLKNFSANVSSIASCFSAHLATNVFYLHLSTFIKMKLIVVVVIVFQLIFINHYCNYVIRKTNRIPQSHSECMSIVYTTSNIRRYNNGEIFNIANFLVDMRNYNQSVPSPKTILPLKFITSSTLHVAIYLN